MTKAMELNDLRNKINVIENILTETNEMLKEQHFITCNGINWLKSKIFKEYNIDEASRIKNQVLTKINADTELRYPHRKILAFLLNQFDFQNCKFKEVHFSKIVKECRLGKNKSKGYLEFLVGKGYLKQRSDGYRVWFMIIYDGWKA